MPLSLVPFYSRCCLSFNNRSELRDPVDLFAQIMSVWIQLHVYITPRAATCEHSVEEKKHCSAQLRRRLKLSGTSTGLCCCGGRARWHDFTMLPICALLCRNVMLEFSLLGVMYREHLHKGLIWFHPDSHKEKLLYKLFCILSVCNIYLYLFFPVWPLLHI